jgi:hypothetical protein
LKFSDVIFNYNARIYSRYDGLCRIRAFITSKNEVFCVITDLGVLNPSSSVTNAIENICKQLTESGLVPSQTKFIEHYENEDDYIHRDSFDFVTFDDCGQPFGKALRQKKLYNC